MHAQPLLYLPVNTFRNKLAVQVYDAQLAKMLVFENAQKPNY